MSTKRRKQFGLLSTSGVSKKFKLADIVSGFLFKVFDPREIVNSEIPDVPVFSSAPAEPNIVEPIDIVTPDFADIIPGDISSKLDNISTVDMSEAKKMKTDEISNGAASERGLIGTISRGLMPRNTRTFSFTKLRRFRFTTGVITREPLNTGAIITYDWCMIPNNNLSWFVCAADFTHMFGPGICGFRVNKIGIRGFAPKINVVQPFISTALISPERPYFMIHVDEKRLLWPQGSSTKCNETTFGYSPNVAVMPPERNSSNVFTNNYQGFSTPFDLTHYKHFVSSAYKSIYTLTGEFGKNPGHANHISPPIEGYPLSDVEIFLDIDSLGGIQLMESGQQFVYQESFNNEMLDVQNLSDTCLSFPSYGIEDSEEINSDTISIPFANLLHGYKESRYGVERPAYLAKGMPVKPILVKVMTDKILVGGAPQIINYTVDFLAEYSIECECEYAGTTGAVDLFTMVNGVPLPNVNKGAYYNARGAMNSARPVKQNKPTVRIGSNDIGNFM